MTQPPTHRMTIIEPIHDDYATLVELFTTLRAGMSRAVHLMGDARATELLAKAAGPGARDEPLLCLALTTCGFLTPLTPSQGDADAKCRICPFASQKQRGFASPVDYIDNALAVLLDPHARDLFALSSSYQFNPAYVEITEERRKRVLQAIGAIRDSNASRAQLDALAPPNIDATGANSATTPRSRSGKG